MQWKLLAMSLNFIPEAGWCAMLCDRWFRERETSSVNMGGDPVTTEPIVFKVDEDVRIFLEDAGMLTFFRKFLGHSEDITS